MTLLWFLCAVGIPFCYACSNMVDQYVVREHTATSVWSFLALSGLVCIIAVLCLWPFNGPPGYGMTPMDMTWVGVAFVMGIMGVAPYFFALKDDDAHNAIPVFQSVPFLTAILAWIFLGETLTVIVMIGGAIIIVASAASLINFKLKTWHWQSFLLILLSSFFWACYNIALRQVATTVDWLAVTHLFCLFWLISGVMITAISSSVRQIVIQTLTVHRGRVGGLMAMQQFFDIAALSLSAAALGFVAVAAAITSSMLGFQPFFVLALSALLARLFPSVYTFTLTPREVLYKITCFVVMLGGLGLVVGAGPE